MMTRLAWVQLYTLMRKEITRFMRIGSQTLIPPIVTTALYFLIFGTVIGERIGQFQNIPYTLYIAPGLTMMAVIMAAYNNVASSFFSAKFQRFLEEILITSFSTAGVVTGYLAGGILRALIVSVLVFSICAVFTGVGLMHYGLALLVVLLTATFFAAAGLMNGIWAKSFDDISFFPSFFLTPLIYLGGVFYPISKLAEPWYQLSLANPIVYFVDAFRYAALGQSEIAISQSLLVLFGFCLVSVACALGMLRHKRHSL